MARILCGQTVLEVERSVPSQVYNRYRIGSIVGQDLNITRFEMGFLALHAKSVFRDMDSESRLNLLRQVLTEENDMGMLIAFSHLKMKGYVLKVEQDHVYFRKKDEKSWRGMLTVSSEQDFLDLNDIGRDKLNSYSIVDGDGGTSMYDVMEVEPAGELFHNSLAGPTVMIGNFRLLAGSADHLEMKKLGFDIYILDRPDLIDSGVSVALKDLVISDLSKRGIAARTGFKYGSHLRLYTRNVEDHADYLLHINDNNKIKWYEVARAVRVASAVRKKFLIALLDNNKMRYFSVSRRIEV
jgi:tRNA splicing endonuclease